MAQFRRGIKAGVLAGIISGLVFGIIFTLLNATIFYGTIAAGMEEALTQIPEEVLESEESIPTQKIAITLAVYGPLLNPIFNLIPSIIIGLFFALLFSRLPGKTAIGKGLFIGIIIWLFHLLLNFLTSLQIQPGYFIFSNAMDLANQLFFGFLLGKFWLKSTFKKS